jgi:hypothetical protein
VPPAIYQEYTGMRAEETYVYRNACAKRAALCVQSAPLSKKLIAKLLGEAV